MDKAIILLSLFTAWIPDKLLHLLKVSLTRLTALTAAFGPWYNGSIAPSEPPRATVRNGTYVGRYQATYHQDYFLGIPYAQAPVGDLRFRVPRSLAETWDGERQAVDYYPHCIGFGFDSVGHEQSEDCLALNVVRPAGYEGKSLPVAVWIHGGAYVMGGTPDLRYNLSFIVQNSVEMNKPFIAVSIAYRLHAFGFIYGREARDEGSTNLGIRDQRLALHWIQENIAAFGGDPTRVTIWGESAGAGSVGIHLIAYGGRDDKLFSGAISQSGSPILLGAAPYKLRTGQRIFDNVVKATGCSGASTPLACLRLADLDTLKKALDVDPAYRFFPYMDNDIIQGFQSDQLAHGKFVKVPYLLGSNTDEGSSFGDIPINNDTQFEEYLNTTEADYQTVKTLQIVYPNIPALGILEEVTFVPNATYGSQWKRLASFRGDYMFNAARRLTSQQWAAYGSVAYAYRFNVIPNGMGVLSGVTHFAEVAFVFHNLEGLGYETNPFDTKQPNLAAVSKLMSCAWVAFIHDGNPNGYKQSDVAQWPVYDNGIGGYGQDFVFDANVKSHAEPDTYRGVAIAYLNTLWKSQFGR